MNKVLPKNYYDAKRLVSKLGLTARRIDCCIQGCMLFYDNEYGKNDGALIHCKFCECQGIMIETQEQTQESLFQ